MTATILPLAIALVALVLLDVLALRYGANSRAMTDDGGDW
jgi:hypothetical protein